MCHTHEVLAVFGDTDLCMKGQMDASMDQHESKAFNTSLVAEFGKGKKQAVLDITVSGDVRWNNLTVKKYTKISLSPQKSKHFLKGIPPGSLTVRP